MKKNNEFVSVRVSAIDYDKDGADENAEFPDKVTVKANPEMLECLVDEAEDLDDMEVRDYIGELVEAATGQIVTDFEYEIKK